MPTLKITKDNFKEEVLQSSIPAMVEFWATWCGPCQVMAPFLEEIAEEKEGQAKICTGTI